jgi:hypothetical protein
VGRIAIALAYCLRVEGLSLAAKTNCFRASVTFVLGITPHPKRHRRFIDGQSVPVIGNAFQACKYGSPVQSQRSSVN